MVGIVCVNAVEIRKNKMDNFFYFILDIFKIKKREEERINGTKTKRTTRRSKWEMSM